MTGRPSRAGWMAAKAWLIILVSLALALLGLAFLLPAQTARGKVAALPAATDASPSQKEAEQQAVRLATGDGQVQTRLARHRADVMAVLPLGSQLTPNSLICALSDCRLVEIYDFDANTTVSVVVDLNANIVRDVLVQSRGHPRANQQLTALAIEIARSAPEFIRELGRVPAPAELSPMLSGVPGSACDRGDYCLAVTVPQGRSLVWAIVDLTTRQIVSVLRTPMPSDGASASPAVPLPSAVCPASGSVTRGGWSLSYETTSTDSFRVFDAAYLGVPVLTSAKIVEWHVDYGSSGFVDEPGCGSYIAPHGETQINDLVNGPDIVGFEVVQDFRMASWGSICNYRYEQHDEFFDDGRFRVVGKAFGQGCSTSGIYRPVMRLDLGLAGPGGDSFETWNGTGWQLKPIEGWWPQAAPYTSDGFKWRLTDLSGRGYFIEPGQGQFGDGGRGDFAFMYATQHHVDEGDTDLPAMGLCCSEDEQQGPEQFVNGESIAGQDIVLWYVPQMQTEATIGKSYCWTVSTTETYPCAAGPMFVPMTLAANFVDSAPQPVSATVAFSSTSGGLGPLTYAWNFGDGLGTSNAANPTYAYGLAGLYTVTLTITDTHGAQAVSQPVAIGAGPGANFDYALSTTISNTISLTNTTSGSSPMSYEWDFGDALTSTAASPSHTYARSGLYRVELTANNFITTNTTSRLVAVPPIRYYWPLVAK